MLPVSHRAFLLPRLAVFILMLRPAGSMPAHSLLRQHRLDDQSISAKHLAEAPAVGTGSKVAAPLHPWQNDERLVPSASLASVLAEGSSPPVMDIYYVRHAQTYQNAHMEDLQALSIYDGHLTPLGFRQAMALNDLWPRLGLYQETPSRVQLASSSLSRAFDTLVLGTRELRQALGIHNYTSDAMEQAPNVVHTVPAAMEVELSHYSQRAPGLASDDPVRWVDSSLRYWSNVSSTHAKNLYQEPFEVDNLMTMKPVEVRTDYPRTLIASNSEDLCARPAHQMDHLHRYLVDAALAGRSKLVLAAHGMVAVCFFQRYLQNQVVPKDNGGHHEISHFMGNAGVLHARLTVTHPAHNASTMVGVRYYPNPLDTHEA